MFPSAKSQTFQSFVLICSISRLVSQFSEESLSELAGEKKSLSQKAELLTKKIQWLRKNEKILTTLYSCCALQGVGGENLPGIKTTLL